VKQISKVVKFIEIEYRMVVTRGLGEDKEGSCLMGVEFHFFKIKIFWKST
jgi:hypothetical protein